MAMMRLGVSLEPTSNCGNAIQLDSRKRPCLFRLFLRLKIVDLRAVRWLSALRDVT